MVGMGNDAAAIVEAVTGVTRGYAEQQRIARDYARNHTVDETYATALALLESELVPARMTGVLLMEELAAARPSLDLLRERVAADPAWQVQEMLARAFDAHCRAIGYEQALPLIEEWLASPVRNQRRAVTEGLRIWTARPFFKQHPEVAIRLLGSKRDDPERYVRESAGNALRDISRAHPDLIRTELATWDLDNPAIVQTYKLASRFVN
jgi:hypothetical protein